MVELTVFLILLLLGYGLGQIAEKRHYQSIEAREHTSLKLPVVTLEKTILDIQQIQDVKLVSGCVVISIDYFKQFVAGLRHFFGGRVITYESLVDRARREAILRMKAQAKEADVILNLRIETASISKGGRKNNIGSIEALAYGTAVTYRRISS